MKSLQKALDLLELSVLQSGVPLTPSRAAEALGLNLATCSRILGELADRGYLERISLREGYRTGPMIQSLALREDPYQQLAEAAREPVRELAEFLRMPVNCCTLAGSGRIMLALQGGAPGFLPWKRFRFVEDMTTTATGRLLLASLNERLCRKFLATRGEKELTVASLHPLRESGKVDFFCDGIRQMGRLIRVAAYPTAAFGFGVPSGADPKEAAERADCAAETIVSNLTKHHRAC